MMTIVLATKNPHKIEEIKSILGSDIDYQTLSDYFSMEVKEVGRTLLENSLAKSLFTFKLTGKPSLADDSGLFVHALNGEPGIYSSRYGKDDNERLSRLLKNLQDKEDRKAVFKAVFVYYFAPDKYEVFTGECAGKIAESPRGSGGFGYDPVFIPRGYKRTFAELGQEIKNRISHRAAALKKFKNYLISADR